MPARVSDLILDRLAAWHVRRIYGYPGDGINGLTSALRRAGDRFDFIQVRHEESAALMACAHAKFGGGLVIALVGDGAMQMNGNSELLTVAKYWRRWRDPRLVVLVLNNTDLNFVTWEQRAVHGDAKFRASQELPEFPYARYAELIGLEGIRVHDPAHVDPTWHTALNASRPVVIEAVVDPNVPPLPPHITFDQAASLLKAVLKGDPDAAEIIRHSMRELAASV